MASPPPSPNPSEMRQDHFCCRVVLEFRSHREGLRRKCMRDVGHLPPLASDKVAGSIDADLLEIEEVLGVRYCDPSQMTAVALRNPVDEDDERLEYLVSGRFGSGPDDCGFHSVAWVSRRCWTMQVRTRSSQRYKSTRTGWIRSSRSWRRRVTRLMMSSRTSAAQRRSVRPGPVVDSGRGEAAL